MGIQYARRNFVPEPLPPILYKYYSPNRVRFFQEPTIRFTCPTEFNDKFDSYSPGRTLVNGIPVGIESKEVGIFCLTEKSTSHLMWVHYAACHTGFVVGFDTSAPVFHQDGMVFDKVIYEHRPPTALTLKGCLNKDPDWKYEEEWRCVKRFREGEPRDLPIDKAVIREVIFGRDIATQTAVAILKALKGENSEFNATLLTELLWPPSGKIYTLPFPMTLCKCCRGSGMIAL